MRSGGAFAALAGHRAACWRRSMRRPISTSWRAVSSETFPISFRYSRTGSSPLAEGGAARVGQTSRILGRVARPEPRFMESR